MRRKPVAFFLGDAAFLSDSKFRALARRLPDADDFNSAVGAYWIALAAARRNGEPFIDVTNETASRFVAVLLEVGLLTSDGFPDVAFRAWAPGRPTYPSDTKIVPAPSAPNGSEVSADSASAASAPPPIPSLPIKDVRGRGVGEGLPNLDGSVAQLWEQATGRSVLASGNYAAEYLDDACRRHPMSEVGAAIIRARKSFDHIPDAPSMVSAMRPILDPLPDRKKVGEAERAAEERAAARRRTQATLEGIHRNGGHEQEPRPGCPMCEAVSA